MDTQVTDWATRGLEGVVDLIVRLQSEGATISEVGNVRIKRAILELSHVRDTAYHDDTPLRRRDY